MPKHLVLLTTLFALSTPAHPGHDEPASGQQAPPSQPVTLVSEEPKPQVTITEADGYRIITANGLPNHPTGQFPGPRNPNAITAQSYRFRVTLTPKATDTPTPYDRQPFGVALNGIPFDPFTAEYWNRDRRSGWREAAHPAKGTLGIDSASAHVQPTGAYHYHGVPAPLVIDQNKMTLLGYAADGFPIYAPYAPKNAADSASPVTKLTSSYQLKPGQRPPNSPPGAYDSTYDQDYEYVPGSGDLDECNGRTGPTPEFPAGTYYYVLTDTYPYIPRLFKGTPDPSFQRRGPGGPPGGPGGGPNGGPGGGRGPGRPGGPPPR
jgi:hypothetical protein